MSTQAAGPARRIRTGPARTLANLSEALESSLFAESIARQPGLLQGLDPRAKLAGALLLLLAISLSHSLAVIAGLYLVTLALAWRSAVPLRFFVRRVWLLLPFFTGVLALPALFTVPGPALVRLPLGLVITHTGLRAAGFLILRVGASVSTAVLLVLTTPWNSLLKALGVLRVPDVIVVILGMTYRYIYLLLHLAGDLFRGRQSRTVGRLGAAEERRLLAASTGVLLSRSVQLSGEVYLAMQARGLRGYPRTMDTFQMRGRDWVALAGVVVVAGGAMWLGR
ncbi:MAG TPA: cobalt ECF transporter T component CbiQ [Anaerolineae bacterium]